MGSSEENCGYAGHKRCEKENTAMVKTIACALAICLLFISTALALPIVLFAKGGNPASHWDNPSNWPFDIILVDDSELLYLDITSYSTGSRIIDPPGTKGDNPHATPHQYECPDLPITITQSYTGTYTESWTQSTSSSINSQIGAGIDGIEASVGTSMTTGHSYTETASEGYALTVNEGPLPVPAGASWDWTYTDYFIHFDGTGKYFVDELVNYVHTFNWSVDATYDLASNGIKVTGGYPCPVPEPLSIVVFGSGIACLAGLRFRRVSKKR